MSARGDQFDVVIAGGGPAGTSAAIHLAMRGARVLLADREKFPRPKLCGEFITPECLDHFARLGVAERMTEAGGEWVSETVFYTRGGRSVTVPSEWFDVARRSALGLSRAKMDARLMRRAREVGVEVLEETQAAGLLIEDGRVRGVSLRECGRERELSVPLTIDATGRARVLARRIEPDSAKRRMPLVAFKVHLAGARGARGKCEIYFYRGGYGGLGPVENDLSNLCFIASARDVRECGSDPASVMHKIVASNKFAARALEDARPATEWLSVALESFGRRKLVPAEGLLAVGDAASFIDPFTGSGMLMALESGELAADAIADWLPHIRAGQSLAPFADDYLARYGRRFNARLRLCSWLRRAAFAPRAVGEAAVLALGASEGLRRAVARATRGRSDRSASSEAARNGR